MTMRVQATTGAKNREEELTGKPAFQKTKFLDNIHKI